MIAPLTCFHRNLEMTSHCAITFIYCGFWGSDVGWLMLLSYKYYLSLRVRAVMLVCVCIPVLHVCVCVCVCARDTTSKGKNNLIFGPTAFEVHSHGWTDASVFFHWSRAVWLCPWGPSAQPVGTRSCCSESEWLYCHFNDIQHVATQWNKAMFLQYHSAT